METQHYAISRKSDEHFDSGSVYKVNAIYDSMASIVGNKDVVIATTLDDKDFTFLINADEKTAQAAAKALIEQE